MVRLALKKINIRRRANPNAPSAVNLVTFTGSVTELKTKNRQVNGVPIKITFAAVFSAALLNMG
jgi:hypothetical protein